MTTADISTLSDDEISALLSSALNTILDGKDLDEQAMYQLMLIIMQGKCSDAMLGALLAALRMKGESVTEITAAAKAMLSLADTITLPTLENTVDIVGTGGDGANLFNVSTASAFVAASAGAVVAKHGGRGVSSSSGSSDLLEQAGIRLNLTGTQVTECIKACGMGFLFAPNHHTAMRHAVPVRRALKTRTIFNILGPLTNPAGVKRSVIGVFRPELCAPLAKVLQNLGSEQAMVICSQDGLDEFSLAAPTHVAELKKGQITSYDIAPADLGVQAQSLDGLAVSSAAQSLELIVAALGKPDINVDKATLQKAQDIIALNAGAAIYVAGRASSHADGVQQAKAILNSGKAYEKFGEFVQFTQSL
ncbi:anthranilate phosphoribosyltransferase [Moraxella caviae]|uniref:Anthranilate phosphoribosyltransferase n=1 Tax=Moraxella caviae TaxID=34060 RepID=A0A1T0A9W2_9GAMM|nr:anthranilate phosphoribosyltransferase [Moraxella caviae]OOR92081.1 anthranilate phosphoribosyltransferase [Moraxella caviae]STZ14435.1 Anthranilate synthase component II [Moraxella caviae]VEW10478.1 Anthranilate synthase component II [Moraxella caviae]